MKLKKAVGKILQIALEPQFRPFEVKLARAAGLALLAWFGVHYGTGA